VQTLSAEPCQYRRAKTHLAQKGEFSMGGSLSIQSVVVAASEHVSCPLGKEAAILNLKNDVYYGLDPVGARVWTLLREPRRVSDIRDALLDEYQVETDRCERDLMDLLERLQVEGLIEVRAAASA
jgi:hypothetical protein